MYKSEGLNTPSRRPHTQAVVAYDRSKQGCLSTPLNGKLDNSSVLLFLYLGNNACIYIQISI